MENGQCEGCGFTGAGLGDAHDIVTREKFGYGLCLDRRWMDMVSGRQRALNWKGQTEFRKADICHHGAFDHSARWLTISAQR